MRGPFRWTVNDLDKYIRSRHAYFNSLKPPPPPYFLAFSTSSPRLLLPSSFSYVTQTLTLTDRKYDDTYYVSYGSLPT